MAIAPERTHKRHLREKATIDHLVHGVSKPTAPDENTQNTVRPPRPACRSKIRSGKNGIRAQAAFRLFDNSVFTSKRNEGSSRR
jgi:hypothetical protein